MATELRLPATTPKEIKQLLEIQRKRLERLPKAHLREFARALRASHGELARRLLQLEAGNAPYTLQQHRLFLVQIEQAMLHVNQALQSALAGVTEDALRQSIHDTLAQAAVFAKEYKKAEITLPLQEAMRLVLGESKLREIEIKRIQHGVQRYGLDGVTQIERLLTQSLLQGETVAQATKRVVGKSIYLDRYWKAERLVRTEMAFAYNAGARKTLDEVAHRDAELWLMWYEHAEGPTWGGPNDLPWQGLARPLDDRVGEDSLRLHGQLRRPGEMFIDPLTGEKFLCPPNRPNDRATLALVRLPKSGGRA